MKIQKFAAAAAALGLAALVLAAPARAQFGSLRETADTPVIDSTGKIIFKPNTLFISPITTFQRTFASVSGGQILANKTSDAGPMVLYEKLYRLDAGRPTFKGTGGTTLSLGFWYWYHNSNVDRYAVYGKYFFNKSVGGQLSIGGDTNTGINEYYGFVLYNVLRAKPKAPVGVQVGIGPYIPRTNLGNPGYTYTVAAAYNISDTVSIVGSIWSLNYKNKFPPFGFTKSSTTVRYTVGVGYSF